ncbi:MAG: flagellar basal body-associated FliL family protein [Spirochaetales bacterium]|nr:flagellar basal body-associated FliL family protein [Spirochaetales bacterium]
MSDQDDINLEGGDAGTGDSGGKKLGGLLPQLLKWVAIVLGALIFIVTVVVITVNVMGSSGKSQTSIPVSEEYTGSREVMLWYREPLGTLQTRTSDTTPASVIVEVALGYPVEDKATPAELSARLVELKDFLRAFFSRKTAAELRNEEKVKIEIRNAINDNILAKTKIRDVRFVKYEIVEQQ